MVILAQCAAVLAPMSMKVELKTELAARSTEVDFGPNALLDTVEVQKKDEEEREKNAAKLK